MERTKLIIGISSVALLLIGFLGYKIITYDARPAVVQAAEGNLQDLVPQRNAKKAELDALNSQIDQNEKSLTEFHYVFDEDQLKAVEGELPFK